MKYQIGDRGVQKKSICENDVVNFAEVSGDFNPLHLNEEYAAKSIFKQRVCHGMLSASLISAVLGTEMPGLGTIILEQKLKYHKPVLIGDTIEAVVEISEIINESKGILRMNTYVKNQAGTIVIDGECIVKAPAITVQ